MLTHKKSHLSSLLRPLAAALVIVLPISDRNAVGQVLSDPQAVVENATSVEEKDFREQVQPLLAKYCLRCHNAEKMKSGVRVDHLTGVPEDRHLALWKGILKHIAGETMLPEDEPELTAAERTSVSE